MKYYQIYYKFYLEDKLIHITSTKAFYEKDDNSYITQIKGLSPKSLYKLYLEYRNALPFRIEEKAKGIIFEFYNSKASKIKEWDTSTHKKWKFEIIYKEITPTLNDLLKEEVPTIIEYIKPLLA